MVQELVTWCTIHRKQGERVPAESTPPLPQFADIDVVFGDAEAPKRKGQLPPRVLDLCRAHWKELVEPMALALAEHGLDVDKLLTDVAPATAFDDEAEWEPCMVCTKPLRPRTVAGHYTSAHPEVSYARLALAAGKVDEIYECKRAHPDHGLPATRGCDEAYISPQGLRMHKVKAHQFRRKA